MYKKESELMYDDFILRLYPEIQKMDPPKKIKTITFQVTEDCCLACTYCYQHHKTKNKMDFTSAKKFIDKLLNDEFELINTTNTFGLIVDFIGGEPFIEIDLIDQIWDYLYGQMYLLNHPWLLYTMMSFSSNGLLIQSPKVKDFLIKNEGHWHVGISIDGNKELHDSCRIDLNGNGSYDRAFSSVLWIKNLFNKMPSTKMTFAPANITYTAQALIDLIEKGYTQISANCVFEEGWTIEHGKIFYNELKQVADYILDNELNEKIFISIFTEDIGEPLDDYNNNNWCGGVADNNIAIDYKGNFYPCIRYMESSLNGKQPPLVLGNIEEGYLSTPEAQKNYQTISNITRRSQSTDECYYCPIASGCAWCSAFNYEINGTPNKRLTYICPMHKARVLANVYYWNKIYYKYNMDKVFKLNLSKEECLKFISEDEYNLLLKMTERGNK